MKQLIKIGAVLSALSIFAAAAVAGPVTGAWRGYVRYDASRLPAEANPNHEKIKAQNAKFAASVRLSLSLNADHTLSLATGQNNVTGTWAQAGNAIQLSFKKGAKVEKDVYILAQDGKSFSIKKGPSTLVFVR